jgi:hypothetical protein
MRRLAEFFLLCVAAFTFFPACKTTDPAVDGELLREVERLQDLFKGAVRVPMTPQIVSQIRDEKKEYLFGEIEYFISVNTAFTRNRAGESSMNVENHEVPRGRRTSRPAPGPQANQGSSSPSSLVYQEVEVLTFREGGSSLNQRRITNSDEGRLKTLSPQGDVFEVHYPSREIVLVFVLNREKNWYDLEFAVEETNGETGGERVPLTIAGTRPRLMINYQTVFPGGETRIQMDSAADLNQSPPPTGGPLSVRPPEPVPMIDDGLPIFIDVEKPPGPGMEPVAGEWDPYPEKDAKTAVSEYHKEEFFLEESYPIVWEDYDESPDFYEGENSVEVEVVILVENAAPPVEEKSSGEGQSPDTGYIIQVGAFRERKNAALAFTALEQAGFSPLYESHRDLTRVIIPAVEEGSLARVKERVKALGFGEPYVRR